MNPGPAEEAGKVATAAVTALSGTPWILALLIFNLTFLGLLAWVGRDTRQHYDNLNKSLLENQARILENCRPHP
jgi:hypothetical protein